ncbi:MAG: hypothetical protein MOIL_00377 [Candidatus Methanolliviera sp. GoM_oil]|nr:MAG: hypothetical protein MOIL_00377 [Candidatus Methanolliviera sp. GoM_oil]
MNNMATLHITQHIRCELTLLPFGTLPLATSYILETLYKIARPPKEDKNYAN